MRTIPWRAFQKAWPLIKAWLLNLLNVKIKILTADTHVNTRRVGSATSPTPRHHTYQDTTPPLLHHHQGTTTVCLVYRRVLGCCVLSSGWGGGNSRIVKYDGKIRRQAKFLIESSVYHARGFHNVPRFTYLTSIPIGGSGTDHSVVNKCWRV